jgi:putative transposase
MNTTYGGLKRLLFLSSTFSINTCSFPMMNNHTHVVLQIDVKQVNIGKNKELVRHWHLLNTCTLLAQVYIKGKQ